MFLDFKSVLEALEGILEVFKEGLYRGDIWKVQPLFNVFNCSQDIPI